MKSAPILRRQWGLVLALQAHHFGASVTQLQAATGLGRRTVYRYLRTLIDAGAPICAATVNGERRYRFLRGPELPPLGFTALQVTALHLARQQLDPLAGAEFVRELDGLLDKLSPLEAQQTLRFSRRAENRSTPAVLKVVDLALRSQRRARIDYRARSASGATSSVRVEPLLLNVADGEPYLRAYCVERSAERTYKLSRIAAAELTDERATYRPRSSPAEAFEHSVKVWSGDPVTVRVRLDPDVARLAREYPLIAGQAVAQDARGAVIVEARVSGVVEAARWVLSWGGAAEALEPRALRKAVRAEVKKALAKYDGPGPVNSRRKSTSPKQGVPRMAGTRRA